MRPTQCIDWIRPSRSEDWPSARPARLPRTALSTPPNGPAISTLTNPDGTYTINGLPPNNYLLYVHPLPPDAVVKGGEGLQLPQGQFGNSYQPGTLG